MHKLFDKAHSTQEATQNLKTWLIISLVLSALSVLFRSQFNGASLISTLIFSGLINYIIFKFRHHPVTKILLRIGLGLLILSLLYGLLYDYSNHLNGMTLISILLEVVNLVIYVQVLRCVNYLQPPVSKPVV